MTKQYKENGRIEVSDTYIVLNNVSVKANFIFNVSQSYNPKITIYAGGSIAKGSTFHVKDNDPSRESQLSYKINNPVLHNEITWNEVLDEQNNFNRKLRNGLCGPAHRSKVCEKYLGNVKVNDKYVLKSGYIYYGNFDLSKNGIIILKENSTISAMSSFSAIEIDSETSQYRNYEYLTDIVAKQDQEIGYEQILSLQEQAYEQGQVYQESFNHSRDGTSDFMNMLGINLE